MAGRKLANRKKRGDQSAPTKTAKARPSRGASNKSNKKPAKKLNIFPVIGMGASAGGLQAFSGFLDAMPDDSGMAFVLIQHLDPEHESLMADLLASHTDMTVVLAGDKMLIEPNHVYVIPPNATLVIKDDKLHLMKPQERHGTRMPVDIFFRSLAAERPHQAIGVVLSGTGTDGTIGLKEIKDAGGMTLVQDPAEAAHDGMPRSAIAYGAADHVSPLLDMPLILQRYVDHPYYKSKSGGGLLGDRARVILDDVVKLLKRNTPLNFEFYKEGTLLRRIDRRMGIHRIEDAGAYLKLLESDTRELTLLSKDLLISVTSFFRDKEVFEFLETDVLPDALRNHTADRPFRIWVAGCATGEEAYSIAMILSEKAAMLGRHLKFQVFATDVDIDALALARNGVYPESIEADVSAARLERFFIKQDHNYQVKPELREAVIFAEHNLLSDAPFSKLDMVSCRNVMIYLDSKIQGRIIQLFHFALNDNGLLMLGTSEVVNSHSDLFSAVDRNHRIYSRKGGRSRPADLELPIFSARHRGSISATAALHSTHQIVSAGDLARRTLLERHTPAAVLINPTSQGLYFSGPIDRYLKVPAGDAGQDLLAMVREGLRMQLRAAIQTVLDTGEAAKSEGASLKRSGKRQLVTIQVEPVTDEEDKLLLVTFKDDIMPAKKAQQPLLPADQSVVDHLERELETTRRDLKVTIRDLETSNEELKAANEEAMSMNEEFQSTNEELETSKEELQSLNEELTTLNNQLQQKVDEHRVAVDDLNNLLNSAQIATLFIDSDLNIKRFTPSTRDLFNLIATDIGRPIVDIAQKFDDPGLLEDIHQVLGSRKIIEREIEAQDGRWFVRRVLPYITQDEQPDGTVLTFNDITDVKQSQQRAIAAQKYAEAIVETVREPLIILDQTLKVVSASCSFHRQFATTNAETVGHFIYELRGGEWDIPGLRKLLEGVAANETIVEGYEVKKDFPALGEQAIVVNARRIEGLDPSLNLILLSIENVTEQRSAQQELEERNARLNSILKSAQLGIITIDEKGIIESFSRAAEDIFGYQHQDVLGKNIKILVPEPDRGKHDGYIANYLKTGEGKVFGSGREVTGLRKNGLPVPLHLSVNEAFYDHARLFTGVVRDMTLEKRHQEELHHAQKMDAMGQLTGGVAHDFNNLLTVVLGNLEMLEGVAEFQDHKQLIDDALEAVELGSQLTSGLLAFGRRLPLNPERIDLNDLVKQMIDFLKRTLPETIHISSVIQPNLWSVVADAAQLRNAILNLALNARDAMEDGGKLIIETSNVLLDEDHQVGNLDAGPGDYIALAVTDTGVGMNPDVKDHAFEPFFTTKEVGKGSGLGLSMVYGFVKQSKGHATIYSNPGSGTTVTLYLPRDNSTPESVQDIKPGAREPKGKGETILVVEDDHRVRAVTVKRLKDLGYKVREAQNGRAALSMLDQDRDIDLLFTDVVMPGGMSGTELVTQVLKREPDMKTLLTSGYAEQVLGLDENEPIIRKPYSRIALAWKLREVLKS